MCLLNVKIPHQTLTPPICVAVLRENNHEMQTKENVHDEMQMKKNVHFGQSHIVNDL